jgi:hypothetical protein
MDKRKVPVTLMEEITNIGRELGFHELEKTMFGN